MKIYYLMVSSSQEALESDFETVLKTVINLTGKPEFFLKMSPKKHPKRNQELK